MAPRGEDQVPDAEIDRQFAELVQHYYDSARGDAAADRAPSASTDLDEAGEPGPRGPVRPSAPAPREDWHAGHPLFHLSPDPVEPTPVEPVDRYVPEPMEPMPRLSRPALIGALMLTTSVLIGLLAVLGLPFPPWVGWLAITGFTIGMVVLLSRLPRHRDPEDGDGAVL